MRKYKSEALLPICSLLCCMLLVLMMPSVSTAANKKPKKKTEQRVIYNKELVAESTFFIDGMKMKLQGDFNGAEAKFNELLNRFPNNDAAMYQLAHVKTALGKFDDALQLMKKAVKLNPNNKWYQILLADTYDALTMYSSSIPLWKKIVAQDPNDLEHIESLLMAQLQEDDYTGAIETYNNIEKALGVSESTINGKVRLWLSMNKVEKAVAEMDKLIKEQPYEVRYYLEASRLYLNNGYQDKAFVYLEKAAQIDTTNADLQLSLAEYYKQRKQYDKMYACISKAFESPTMNVDKKIEILLSYYTLSEHDTTMKAEGFKLIETMVRVHPEEPKAWAMYGDYLYRDELYEQAATAFKTVLCYEQSYYAVWDQLILSYFNLGKEDSVLTYSEQAIDLFPMQPYPYYYAGLALLYKEAYKDAVVYFEQAVRIIVDNDRFKAQVYARLGDAYNELKMPEKSDAAYEQSLRLYSDNVLVLNNYAYYLSVRNKDLSKAENMASLAVRLDPDKPTFEDTYAWVLYKQQKYAEARKWLEKAIQHSGAEPDADILEHYGDTLYQLGEKTQAMEAWKKALNAPNGGSDMLEKKIQQQKLIE